MRLELVGDDFRAGETPFYLTTDTPESQTTPLIIATRPKPEATTTKLRVGERVVATLTSFTVLPATEKKDP
jgi:hypothetical protein